MGIPDRTAAIVSGSALVIHGALKRGGVGAVSIGIGAVIAYLGLRMEPDNVPTGRQLLRASQTTDAEPYDAFLKWQDLSELSSVIREIRSVKKMDNGNWRLSLPEGFWEVQVAHEQPGHVIEWRSVEGAKIDGRCIVRFTRKKNGRGTKVHTEVSYGPAGNRQRSLQTA
jgi:uncharacterized membrane protein